MSTASHTDYFVTAGTLLAAFKRTDNQEAWCLVTHDNDELTSFVRELHAGELPNDWRYDAIHWILNAITSEPQETDWSDIPWQYAENYADLATSDLLHWYAQEPSRLNYIDDANENGLIPPAATSFDRLRLGQYIAIERMTCQILSSLRLLGS